MCCSALTFGHVAAERFARVAAPQLLALLACCGFCTSMLTSPGSSYFLHARASGVVIGETAVVGDNVSMLHHVTLGGSGTGKGMRHPVVGNGVLLGAGVRCARRTAGMLAQLAVRAACNGGLASNANSPLAGSCLSAACWGLSWSATAPRSAPARWSPQTCRTTSSLVSARRREAPYPQAREKTSSGHCTAAWGWWLVCLH
jgi:hypothetical protein